ncbi:hypothetical protein V2S84_09480 [Azotobacter chroococcum]|nr:hypothetical protein [Azotobacter chroococcum]
MTRRECPSLVGAANAARTLALVKTALQPRRRPLRFARGSTSE